MGVSRLSQQIYVVLVRVSAQPDIALTKTFLSNHKKKARLCAKSIG